MSIGEKLKRLRRLRGMTQKELGIALGLPEGTASVRIAQYEGNYRVPKVERIEEIARILDVETRCIITPSEHKEEDVSYLLLEMEELFPEMKLQKDDKGRLLLNFHDSKMDVFFSQWNKKRDELERGVITAEEYSNWKLLHGYTNAGI